MAAPAHASTAAASCNATPAWASRSERKAGISLPALAVAVTLAMALALVWASSGGGSGAAGGALTRSLRGEDRRAGCGSARRCGGPTGVTLLVANNQRLKELGPVRLRQIMDGADQIILFNHAALFEELEAAAALGNSSGSNGVASVGGGGDSSTRALPGTARFKYTLFLPINKRFRVYSFNASRPIRHPSKYARILCGASPLLLWVPDTRGRSDAPPPLPLPLNASKARGEWQTVASVLVGCPTLPALQRLDDGFQAAAADYDQGDTLRTWPSSGFYVAAHAVRRQQRHVVLLGFKASDYNGTGFRYGHNSVFVERMYRQWEAEGVLTRINPPD